jgi:hypothetical protein
MKNNEMDWAYGSRVGQERGVGVWMRRPHGKRPLEGLGVVDGVYL